MRSVLPFLAGAAAVLFAGSFTKSAKADEILVFQKTTGDVGTDSAGTVAAGVLTDLGHTVTLVSSGTAVLPALGSFDTVWMVSLFALTGLEQAALMDFVNAGGGLYVSGESLAYEPLNMSIRDMLAMSLRMPLPVPGGSGMNGANDMTATVADPFGVTTTPNAVPTWTTVLPGVFSVVQASRSVYQNAATSKVGAALFPGEDLKRGGGCSYIAMDVGFWQVGDPDLVLAPYAENIETFLSTCADSDGDGLSDESEAGFGTDPDNPDTDGDGLCDGGGTVEGVCISGEHPLDDFDNDGIPSSLDDDDDNDGVPTAFEVMAEAIAPDADGDGKPAWLDGDSDGDGHLDMEEGTGDYDNDGIPAIVDADDFPMPCTDDSECGDPTSGLVCDPDLGVCQPGCRGTGGNGCPTGQTCTSTDDSIGECIGGEGGGGPGGGSAEGGGSSNGGASETGGSSNSGGSGGGSSDSGDDDGCGCTTAGLDESRLGIFAAAALAAIASLRRRRRAR